MNKRQKKKMFKKRFGFNPPRNIRVDMIMKLATPDVWEGLKQMVSNFYKALKEILVVINHALQKAHGQCMEAADLYRNKLQHSAENPAGQQASQKHQQYMDELTLEFCERMNSTNGFVTEISAGHVISIGRETGYGMGRKGQIHGQA